MAERRVAVVGMGAAGSFAAIFSARKKHEVHIFDGNEKVGKKIYITGKGRCNLTNSAPLPDFMEGICHNRSFLYSSFALFSSYEIMAFFEETGLKLKEERGGRIFPKSDHSSDVIRSLERSMDSLGVKKHLKDRILNIEKSGEGFRVISENVPEGEYFDALVLATGGKSYPSTGSTGDGYRFAQKLGHTVHHPTPSLVPFLLKDSFIPLWEGISLRNVALHAQLKGEKFSQQGEMVVTKTGISGPIVLRLSALLSGKKLQSLKLHLDFKPALSDQMLHERILREVSEHPAQNITTMLLGMLVRRCVPAFLETLELNGSIRLADLTRHQRYVIVDGLKRFTLHFASLAPFSQAVVTRGGVETDEINPNSMESKICKNLFFAGEIIDVDAFTGGYNLSIAFSTGYMAGINT